MHNNEIQYEKDKKFDGNSGTIWKPNFYTNNREQKFLIYVLSAENKSSTSDIVYRINAAWDDLKYKEEENFKFLSFFDDRHDIWKDSQKKLLRQNSIIKNFSNRNDLRNTLIGIN